MVAPRRCVGAHFRGYKVMAGGKVALSEGTFNTSAVITHDGSPLSIVGQGMYATIIKLAASSNVGVMTIGNTTAVDGFYLAHLTLDGNKANQTSGHGLRIDRVQICLVDHVRVINAKEDGITGSGFESVKATLRDCYVEGADGWSVDLTNQLSFLIEGGTFNSNTSGGIRFTKSSGTSVAKVVGAFCQDNGGRGIEFNGLDMGTAHACHLKGNTGVSIHGVNSDYFSAVGNIVESGLSNGIDNGGALVINIVGNTVKNITTGSEQRGIVVASGTLGGVVDANVCDSCGHQGILISDCSDILVSDNWCRNNGQSGSQPDGIRVWANTADVNHITLRGNRCFDDQGVPTQTNGIHLRAEAGRTQTGATVEGNNVTGNGTNNFVSAGAGTVTGTVVRNNRGFVTEAEGLATILSGTTSIVVNHGLSITPDLNKMMLTIAEIPTNAPRQVIASTPTSTQFTIETDADPGASNMNVRWSYRN